MFDHKFIIAGIFKFAFQSNSNLTLGKNENLLLNAYLPGIAPAAARDFKPNLTILHRETKKPSIARHGNQIIINDSWHDTIPPDFYHLLYSIIRLELIKVGKYSVHAACVAGEKNVLIVGHSGTGKTNITLTLASSASYKIFSGNKTVIEFDSAGKLTATAGTSTITLSAEKANKKWRKTFHGSPYGQRLAFFLDEKFYATEQKLSIHAIAMVNLNDGVEICGKLSTISALHTLFPFFLDKVNADTIIFGGNHVFVGNISETQEQQLVARLCKSLARIPVYKISGSLNFVTKAITKL